MKDAASEQARAQRVGGDDLALRPLELAAEHCAYGATIGPCAREHATPCDIVGVSMPLSVLPYWMVYFMHRVKRLIWTVRLQCNAIVIFAGKDPLGLHDRIDSRWDSA